MSLRSRVVVLVASVLLIGVGLGAVVAGYHAKHALAAELTSGLSGGERTVRSAFEDLPNSDHQQRDLRQLIATFEGNRHVEARLLNADGVVLQASHAGGTKPAAPLWFVRLLGRPPGDIRLQTPRGVQGRYTVVLEPTPAIDAAAAWDEFTGVVLVLAVSAAIGLGLVYLAIGAALRPISALAAEFARIGSGDYTGRVEEKGPADLASLQKGFNIMASQLAATLERNHQLTDQLLTIQDEERADIARDLHDEIGPYLFSSNMDIELIMQLIASDRIDEVPERVRSIKAAVNHMQSEVRQLLDRLRPARVTEFGLNAGIKELARRWSDRRSDLQIELDLTSNDNSVSEQTKEAAYRIAQEAASNAVRHARLKTLIIRTDIQNHHEIVVTIFNDGESLSETVNSTGYGLIGMRERVALLGGSLACGPNTDGSGWTVVARLPLSQQAVAMANHAEANHAGATA